MDHMISLPSDVLTEIFLTLASSISWDQKQYLEQVSHICKYWRSVSLGCPLLWNRFAHYEKFPWKSYPNNDKRNERHTLWVLECKRRSRSAPIHLVWKASETWPSAVRPDVFFQPWNETLASLALVGNQNFLISNLQRYTNAPSFALHSLTLQYDMPHWGEDDLTGNGTNQSEATPKRSCLDLPIFANNVPNLQTLYFEYCMPEWQLVRSCTRLQQLVIRYPPPYCQIDPRILSPFSRLESLAIVQYWDPRLSPQVITSNAAVQLPALTNLSLYGSTSWVASLIECLSLPAISFLSLSGVGGTESELRRLQHSVKTNILANGTSILSQVPFHHLRVAQESICATLCQERPHYADEYGCFHDLSKINSAFYINLTSDWLPSETNRFAALAIQSLLSFLNQRHVVYLSWSHRVPRFDGSDGVDLDKEYLGGMDRLEVLSVKTTSAQFLEGLSPLNSGDNTPQNGVNALESPNDKVPTYCPLLHTIRIQVESTSAMDWSNIMNEDFTSSLYTALRKRDRKIRVLDLSSFDYVAGDVVKLAEVVEYLKLKATYY
ncbi:hypothetical protein AX16_001290 [Volvariella volvacea WC 439]|nr:hypothetical protein AX16_001290 [Volvariella volvacea WC 439]